MDYTDLADISKTITAIIKTAIGTADAFPELLRNERNGVGFYLFHVQENSHYKNYPPTGKDIPSVNYIPMALNLFYQLSANWFTNSIEDAIEEQNLMSLAMKALHDHAEIKTSAGGKEININITLQTLSPSESVQYWAAADSPVRLSAYYEVSVVFLQPEETRSYAGRVLSYGNFIFLKGTLQITGSQNIIEYRLPSDPPGAPLKQVMIQPAQAPPANPLIVPVPIASVISFFGTGFNAGSPELLLISPLWEKPVIADNTWFFKRVSENQVEITIQPTAIPEGSLLPPVDVIPGLYAAQLRIKKEFLLPNGTVKKIHDLSNQFPFSVMPRIDSIIPTGIASAIYTITGHLFQYPNIKNDDVQVYVGETPLSLTTVVPPGQGKFNIIDKNTLNINVPASVHGTKIPLRIMVRGIESVPNWIDIP